MACGEQNDAAKQHAPWVGRLDVPLLRPLSFVGLGLARSWPIVLGGAFVLSVCLAFQVDCLLARWCLADHCPRDLTKLLSVSEAFGHGIGVLLIVLAAHQLDPPRRWATVRVLSAAYGSGLAANVVKMLVTRTRPHHFDFEGGVLATFGQWLPLTGAGSAGQSFPSAHTATAVGLAVALAWLYPRGRWFFGCLAVLVACQRIESGAHYLSDTLCGAALGLTVAGACVHFGPLCRWFDRLEVRRLGRSPGGTSLAEEPSRPAKHGLLAPGSEHLSCSRGR